MKMTSLTDIEKFKKVINECEGPVWLESIHGDYYNLKSELSQYIAMVDLLRDKHEDLELFAQYQADKSRLGAFLSELRENQE